MCSTINLNLIQGEMLLLPVVILWAKTQQKDKRNLFSHIKDNETMIMINVSVINNSLIIA